MRGKLAFFDLYRLHWTEANLELLQTVRRSNRMRQEWVDLLTAEDAFLPGEIFEEKATDSRFRYRTAERELWVRWERNLAGQSVGEGEARLLYRNGFEGAGEMAENRDIPGEMIVLLRTLG